MSKRKITLSSILALLSGSFGLIGASGWCCTITGAAVLSFLGLASISGFLVYNSKWLFFLSFIFTGLAIFYYITYKKNKNCLPRCAVRGRGKIKNKYAEKD
jgi:uncharacterized sodium:solute symporter family permease YidK